MQLSWWSRSGPWLPWVKSWAEAIRSLSGPCATKPLGHPVYPRDVNDPGSGFVVSDDGQILWTGSDGEPLWRWQCIDGTVHGATALVQAVVWSHQHPISSVRFPMLRASRRRFFRFEPRVSPYVRHVGGSSTAVHPYQQCFGNDRPPTARDGSCYRLCTGGGCSVRPCRSSDRPDTRGRGRWLGRVRLFEIRSGDRNGFQC